MDRHLRLFVYGSLKTGECNASVLSRWVRKAVPGRTPGRMYLRPDGYPALWVPRFCALGTDSYEADAALAPAARAQDGHDWVTGEVLTLETPLEVLPRLDDFEGYFPDRPSEYRRVLVEVSADTGWTTAWTYVCPDQGPAADWLPIPCWPPPGARETPAPYRARRP